jgi:hypothetical protein
MKTFIELGITFLIGVAVIIVTSFIMGIPVSWLWNLFCPKVFGLPVIDWIDGAVLYILCNLLFANVKSTKE